MHTDIDELTDDLLSIQWRSRFESFTTKETAFLARYNDFAWLLGNRSFFREPPRLSITASATLTHAGTESLELAAITLRQAWQQGDTPHEKVTTTLRCRATGEHRDETVELLEALDILFEFRRSETLMSFVDGEDMDAGRWPKTIRDITATEVLDHWTNGTSVHLSPKKAAAVAEWPAHQYEWSVIKAVTSIAQVVLATHVVVRGALGVLDDDRRVTTGPGFTATSVVPRRD